MGDQDNYIIKINLPGGIVPAGELLEILNIAQSANITTVRFGNRQQLMFAVPGSELEDLKNDLLISDFNYEIDADEYPNIVSSYVTEDIIFNANWLTEGVYKDILDLFDFSPKLKINLVDQSQTFVPFFTGNINFISSEISNYWYLYVRFPKTNILFCWPSLIYSDDIPAISKLIEQEILTNRETFYDQPVIDGTKLYEQVAANGTFTDQPYTHTLELPEYHLPFYEGFNRYGNGKLWLGAYRRNEQFSVGFLKDICELCLKTRIGQLYTTPWKSIVVKGIATSDRKYWSNILNRHQINIRHSSNELNWQVEELCQEGLDLKQQLVRELEEADIRTYRLCFAVKTKPKSGLFGSIIINKQKGTKPLFDILHTPDFNPNAKVFNLFKTNVEPDNLSRYLIELCDYFYSQQGKENLKSSTDKIDDIPKIQKAKQVHQCTHCLTVYDDTYGDTLNNAIAGTDFDTLNNYICPTCGAEKQDFVSIDKPTWL